MLDPAANIGGLTIRVMKYLEEASNEAICIASDTYTVDSDNCPEYRDKHGLVEGEASTCWLPYYNKLTENIPLNYHSTVDWEACDYSDSDECLGLWVIIFVVIKIDKIYVKCWKLNKKIFYDI